MRRNAVIALGVLSLILCINVTSASPASNDAEKFIRAIGNKTLSSLREKGISEQERVKRFKELLEEAFDLPRIARFTLGRYWRVATNKEKEEFVELFKKFVIQAYANRFQELSGKSFSVIKARGISTTQALVMTEILVPQKPSIRVNWRVRSKNHVHKITDVVVEGISMSVTQRDEFVSVIRQRGGKVEGLIRALRKKTTSN